MKSKTYGSIVLVTTMWAAQSGASSILEEVVVTAQKREQAITDVALTVTALNGETVRAMGIADPRDVSFLATNLDIKNSAQGDANPAITLRGIGMNNFNANNNPSVGIYMDEVFLASPAMMNLNMMDVGRIEVLKGPQGTLYGRNATGGAVNIISAKPTREAEGYASLSLADYDSQKLEAAVSGSLSDTLAGRLSLLYDNQGESFHEYHRASGGTGEFEDSSTSAFRAQLGGGGTSSADWWNLGVSYLDQDIGNNPFMRVGGYWNQVGASTPPMTTLTEGPICQGALGGCYDTRTAFSVDSPAMGAADRDGDPYTHDFQESRVKEMKVESDVTSVNFNLHQEFDSLALAVVAGYIQQDRDYGENTWSNTYEAFAAVHEEELEQYSLELRLSGETGAARWMAGAYIWNDTFDSDNTARSVGVLGILAGINPVLWTVKQETDAYAAFANADWTLADRWMLTLGLRYSDEETDFKGGTRATVIDAAAFALFAKDPTLSTIPANTTISLTSADDSTDDTSTDFRLALEFRPNDDILAYGSVTTGFKSGGFFGDFTFDNGELAPYDSETVTAWELGIKATLADSRAQLNGAVFYYDYEDIQAVIPASFGFKLDNLDEAEITGVEVELLATPAEGLELRLGASYLDSEVTSDLMAFDGKELPNAPEKQFTATIRYEFPVMDAWNLAFQVDSKYTDGMFRESSNNPWMEVDSYTLYHGRISLFSSDGTWEVAAWGKNLGDEEYDEERFASDVIGEIVAGQGAPRQIGMTLNYSF